MHSYNFFNIVCKIFKRENLNLRVGIIMSEKLEGLMNVTMDKIKGLIDVDSIIGKPIVFENITIIPVSKVSYGFGSGGSDFGGNKQNSKDLFGGGSGAGVTILPIGFLVINNGDVKLLQIESFSSHLDRIVAMTPEILEKIKGMFSKKQKKSNSD